MTRPNVSAAMLAQLNASRSKPGHLYEAYFDDESVYFTDFYTNVPWNGNTYVADGEALTYDGVQEDLEMRAPMARIVFSGVDQSWVQRVLAKQYRNRRLVIRKATLDAAYQVVIDPVPEFDGLMKQPQVQDDPDNGTCTIVFSASHDASDVNNASGRRTNDEFQRKLYPNDGFFKYASQAGKHLLLGGGVSAQTTSTQTAKATSPANSVATAGAVIGLGSILGGTKLPAAVSSGDDQTMTGSFDTVPTMPAGVADGSDQTLTGAFDYVPPASDGVASGADQSLSGAFDYVPTMPGGVASGADQSLTGAFDTMPQTAAGGADVMSYPTYEEAAAASPTGEAIVGVNGDDWVPSLNGVPYIAIGQAAYNDLSAGPGVWAQDTLSGVGNAFSGVGGLQNIPAIADSAASFVEDVVSNPIGAITGGGCFITTAVMLAGGKGDDAPELQTLRALRDNVLMKTPTGQQLVAEYYRCAPHIVAAIDARADRLEIYADIKRRCIDWALLLCTLEEPQAAVKIYMLMVNDLKSRFLPVDEART